MTRDVEKLSQSGISSQYSGALSIFIFQFCWSDQIYSNLIITFWWSGREVCHLPNEQQVSIIRFMLMSSVKQSCSRNYSSTKHRHPIFLIINVSLLVVGCFQEQIKSDVPLTSHRHDLLQSNRNRVRWEAGTGVLLIRLDTKASWD